MAMNRGWLISAVLFGGIGVIFLLWGLGVNLGRWWPVFFAIIGFASLVRGFRERENLAGRIRYRCGEEEKSSSGPDR